MKNPSLARPYAVVAFGVVLVAAIPFVWLRQSQQEEIRALRAQLEQDHNRPATPPDAVDPSATTPGTRQPARNPMPSPTSLGDILALPDPAARIRAILAYADTIPTAKIAATIQQLRESSPDWDPDARAAIHLLLTRWASEAPDQALASLQTLDPTKQGGDATSILSGIAATDPLRAAKWLEDPDNRMTEWMKRDPNAATEWATRNHVTLP